MRRVLRDLTDIINQRDVNHGRS